MTNSNNFNVDKDRIRFFRLVIVDAYQHFFFCSRHIMFDMPLSTHRICLILVHFIVNKIDRDTGLRILCSLPGIMVTNAFIEIIRIPSI